jgi:hypothetical protein
MEEGREMSQALLSMTTFEEATIYPVRGKRVCGKGEWVGYIRVPLAKTKPKNPQK